MTALKLQISQDSTHIEDLTSRNVRMNGELGQLMATIRKMEGEVSKSVVYFGTFNNGNNNNLSVNSYSANVYMFNWPTLNKY